MMRVVFNSWNSSNDRKSHIIIFPSKVVITRKELRIIANALLSVNQSTNKEISICLSGLGVVENSKYRIVYEEFLEFEFKEFLKAYSLICRLTDDLPHPDMLGLLIPFDKIKRIYKKTENGKLLIYERKIIEQTTE